MDRSRSELLADGWVEECGVKCLAYPAADHIILSKDGLYIRHLYSVYDDYSDYPAENACVNWTDVEIYTQTIRLCKDIS